MKQKSEMAKTKENKSEKVGIFKAYHLLWKIMTKRDKCTFIFILLSSIVSSFVCIFPSQATAVVISKISGETINVWAMGFLNSWGTVESIFFLMGMCSILWVIGMINYMIVDIFARRMICLVHEKAMDTIFEPRKNLDFNMTSGEVNYIIKNASDNVYSLIENFCWSILNGVLSSIVIAIQIALIDPITFLAFLGTIILIAICIFIRVKIQEPIVERIEKHNAKIGNTLLKSIFNLPLITIVKSKIVELIELKKQNDKFYKEHKKRAFVGFLYWVFVITLEFMGFALIAFVAIKRKDVAGISVSEIILMLTYINYCYGPIEQMGFILSSLQSFAIKICNLFKLEVKKPVVQKIVKDTLEDVEIEKISINDLQVSIQSFKNVYNCEFYKGNLTTICGKSGTGKTTLINCLCGLREYQKGEILINDTYKVKSLLNSLNKVSYTFQDAMLFDRSLKENIFYPNLPETERSKELIKTFGLQKLINRETENSDILNSLSGGEKKRISLIRGILTPADVYIFDEPTNELDKKNVDIVINQLKELSKEKIVIIISHDSRVLDVSDVIINLEDNN